MSPKLQHWLTVLGLFGVAISLGSGHVFARLAFNHGANVLAGATVRAVSASLLVYLLLRVRGLAVMPLPREFRTTLLLGLFITVQTASIQLAVSRLPVAFAILVFYSFPVITGFTAALVGDARMSWRLFATLAAAFAGLALVLGPDLQVVDPVGVIAALVAAISFSAALVFTPRLAPTLAPPVRTFYTLIVGAAIFLAAVAATGDVTLPVAPQGWIGLAGLGLAYGIGITSLFLLLPRLGAAQTAVILNLEPVFVAVIGWLLLGEHLAPIQVTGILVVVGAVIAYQASEARR